MRLKRLELTGFKTFADRTALEFSPRLTAIVGPNGSGKSNIFDSIRWALGEGSLRALRGVRNEDVIFAGSERRRPLAMADVTLVLDNGDGTLMMPLDGDDAAPTPLAFAEVTVTRRALRAADSRYFINTLPCRLRDIQTMFLGTGLGGHTYALVTQGEVDRMLDATPEERRMILEEAAGLAKFKRRRHDAERRMAAADQLLLRVADILAEQDARVETLAAQADAARQYQAYTQELRGLELAVQVEEVRRLARAQKRVQDQLEQIAVKRRDVERSLAALAEERAALDRRAADAGREWDDAQRSLVRLTERRAAEESAAQLLAERRRGVAAQRARLDAEIAREGAEAGRLADERDDLARQDRSLAAEAERRRGDVAAAQDALLRLEESTARDEARAAQARDDARALADSRARAHADFATADARVAAYLDRAAAIAGRLRHLREQAAEITARRETLTAELAQITAALDARRSALRALRNEHEQGEAHRDELLAEVRRVEMERETLRSRLAFLEEAHAQFRGYDAGARDLLLARRREPERFTALRAVVAEVIRAPREIRPAVEAALGAAASALIVGTIDDAHALRQAAGGEAGEIAFLPLALVRPLPAPALPAEAAADPGFAGRVLDHIEVEGEHAGAVRGLLGDAVFARDLEAAVRIRAAGYEGRIVTLAGDGVSALGVVTTGRRAPGQTGTVGRAEEIAEARAALERLEAAARDCAARIDAATARLREMEAAVAQADAGITEESDRRGDADRRLVLLDAERARIDDELAALAAEARAAEDAVREHEQARDRFAAEAAALEQRIAGLEGEAEDLSVRLRDQALAARGAREALTEARVAITELEGRRAGVRARAAEAERSMAAADERRRALELEGTGLDADAAALEAEEAAARERCAALTGEGERLEASLAALDEERAAVAGRRAEVEQQHADAAGRAEALAEDVHRVELRQAQVDAEIGSARRRIEEEFGLPFDRAASEAPESIERDETLGRIEALRGLIASLGPVNLIAIEEHRAAVARADALREQYDDVAGALEALRGLIADLETVIRERFEETYRAVNDEFSGLFVRLFGGGRAGLDLVTVEGSDEPGIDIVVQPPGKNLRSLSALSGGERVMVSLALIFAMLRVRPSPFCVFDEVEAALDEANTRKVAEVLRELTEQTQIIIITHNKATMESCDVLFGVTMEEPGVSHMVSVRLQEAAQTGEDAQLEQQPVG
ncbi:MAG TPA: chromosome segregation protein SMC [bacterium]|nr:chromosome segregation protein SMC [bacterium]